MQSTTYEVGVHQLRFHSPGWPEILARLGRSGVRPHRKLSYRLPASVPLSGVPVDMRVSDQVLPTCIGARTCCEQDPERLLKRRLEAVSQPLTQCEHTLALTLIVDGLRSGALVVEHAVDVVGEIFQTHLCCLVLLVSSPSFLM